MLARLPLLARIEARRVASWIAAVGAAAAAGCLPLAMPPGLPDRATVAVVLGGLFAVAAGGAVPRTGSGRLDRLWLAARLVFPAAGWLAAALARGEPAVGGWAAAGVALGGAWLAVMTHAGLVAADAAGASLMASGIAGGVGWWAAVVRRADGEVGGMAAVAMLIAGVGLAAVASGVARQRSIARHAARHLLTGGVMAAALFGMVVWLFLAPEAAPLDLVASLAWFVAAAVPAATLGDGVGQAAAWRQSDRAAPRAGTWPRRLPPGRCRDAALGPLVVAAILGWPPLVAAVVAEAGADAGRPLVAIGIVAALAAAAAAVVAVAALGEAAGVAPDALQAGALTAVGLAVALACGVAAAAPPPEPPDFMASAASDWR